MVILRLAETTGKLTIGEEALVFQLPNTPGPTYQVAWGVLGGLVLLVALSSKIAASILAEKATEGRDI